MRGVGTTVPRAGRAQKAVIAAVAVLAALGLLVSGCGTGGTGARDEGPASDAVSAGGGVEAEAVTPSPPRAQDRAEAIRLVRADPGVSPAVKRDLKPCFGDEYPVDVSYGKLTGGSTHDILVNVMTCDEAVGVGSYVYREEGDAYKNVFRAEEPPVYAEIDRGDLVVTQQVYEKGDSLENPSGEEVVTYRWMANRFAERGRITNDYSKVVGGETPLPTEK
ncbi:hypothetical protein [Streptomyces sp. NBC_00878]|uniref:hypothetical protein n=1 Tax=Streptomyces sp. NBC_00878 TaxID=2975854 RepID=UPI00225BDAEA|nr:hypothetical protein [Streptomyces sp. NBC_00878]MCX4907812.1 hypothetical protein [Streptomyces sp. NBC_00878]